MGQGASSSKKWVRPDKVEKLYASATGNRFAGLNSPVAGAREQAEAPKGDKPIQLYSLGTPNGQKVGIMLEETGLPYDAHFVTIFKGEQFKSYFVDINPNSKIPAMVDREGPGGKSVRVFETSSILLYLAEKTGQFIPKDPAKRVECMNWLFFSHGAAPYFGNFGHFVNYAPAEAVEARNYGVARFGMETQRLLSVIDQQLEGKQYLVGDEYTIADMALYPWIICLDKFYNAKDFLSLDQYKNVMAYLERIGSRPAVQRGMEVTSVEKLKEMEEQKKEEEKKE